MGAPKSDNLENGINSGAAYVFERNSSNQWVETAKLVPSELSVNDQFGISVAISGEFIFVGSLRADGIGVDTGGVFVFQKLTEIGNTPRLSFLPILPMTNYSPPQSMQSKKLYL